MTEPELTEYLSISDVNIKIEITHTDRLRRPERTIKLS